MMNNNKFKINIYLIILFIIVFLMPTYARGWVKENGEWYYKQKDGTYATSQMKASGNKKYYLDEKGNIAKMYYLQDYDNKSYFYNEEGLITKYGCVIIEPSTKSNKAIDNDYVLYFNYDGSVISKTLLTNDNIPLNYVESRHEYLK